MEMISLLGKMKMSRTQQSQQQADTNSLQMAEMLMTLQESRQSPKIQATSEIGSEKLIRSEKG